MNLFFLVGSIILFILSILLVYTTKKLPEQSRKQGYFAGFFCIVVGFIAMYIGLV